MFPIKNFLGSVSKLQFYPETKCKKKKLATIIQVYAVAMRKNKICSHKLYIIGPEEEQQEIGAHHTILFGDGDCVKVQNKVTIFICVV